MHVVHTPNGILLSLTKQRISDMCYIAQMNLEDMMLSEISQSQKDKYCYDSHDARFLESSGSQTERVESGCQGLRREDGELVFHTELQFGDMRKFWKWMVVIHTKR